MTASARLIDHPRSLKKKDVKGTYHPGLGRCIVVGGWGRICEVPYSEIGSGFNLIDIHATNSV